MSELVEAGRPYWRAMFKKAANPVSYQPQGGASTRSIGAFIRGLRADDLFASASQQDSVAIIDAVDFSNTFPARPYPTRYDRFRTATRSYAVEEWRGSPNDETPVFYKILVRGAFQ